MILEKTAQKWNFEKQEYEDYDLPMVCPLLCYDMKKIIDCANCSKKIEYQEGYCSKTIHNKHGFGYPVCEECYLKELEDESKYKSRE